MKKLFALSVLFVLLTGAVFAQGLTFSGNIQSGLLLTIPDQTDQYVDPLLRLHNQGVGGTRLELNGAYTNEAGNVGGNFRLRATVDANWNRGSLLPVDIFRIWFKPIDMFTIFAGMHDNNKFGTMGGVDANGGVGGGLGLMFELEPVNGVLVGLSIFPRTASQYALSEGSYRLGARYTLDDVLRVSANFAFNFVPSYSEGNFFFQDHNTINAAVGFDIYALRVAGIQQVAVDVMANGLHDFVNLGVLNIGQRIRWAMGDFDVGLRAIQYIPVRDDRGKSNFGADFLLWANYKIDGTISITPGLDVGFAIGDELNSSTATSSTSSGVVSGGLEHRAWDGLYRRNAQFREEGTMSLIVNPRVAFGFANGNITLGYNLMMQSGINKDKLRHAAYVTLNAWF